jgi:hypothetical protein
MLICNLYFEEGSVPKRIGGTSSRGDDMELQRGSYSTMCNTPPPPHVIACMLSNIANPVFQDAHMMPSGATV